jgi:DNA-binding MarR family transcriptional regulator
MQQHLPPDTVVEGWLQTLGVVSLCQWHVLLFLSRHQTTLLGVEYLARLLGYATEPVVAALDVLESLDLVERSRLFQGVRLYKFTAPSAAERAEAFARLQALAGHRTGRLLIYRQLRPDDRTPEEIRQSARRYLEKARRGVRAARRYAREYEEKRKTWRQAI